jgi:hypothetical protein
MLRRWRGTSTYDALIRSTHGTYRQHAHLPRPPERGATVIGEGQLTAPGDVRLRIGRLLALLALPLMLFLGNPALALLAGGAIVLLLDRRLIPSGSTISKYCLQAAIVLLGLRLDLATLWQLSASYSWAVAAYVLCTLAVGLLVGRWLSVEPPSSKLIASGTAICGGTAIASLSTIVRAQPHQTAVALAMRACMSRAGVNRRVSGLSQSGSVTSCSCNIQGLGNQIGPQGGRGSGPRGPAGTAPAPIV